jgi:hypothetical protein
MRVQSCAPTFGKIVEWFFHHPAMIKVYIKENLLGQQRQ